MRQPLRASVTLRLDQIAGALGLPRGQWAADAEVRGVATDSRDVRRGDLFVALRGERFDGHRFIPDAIRAGAAALLVAEEVTITQNVGAILRAGDTIEALGSLARFWRRELGLRVVAVTGSNGKTTTKELIAAGLGSALRDPSRVLATPGNFNNLIGVPLTLLSASAAHAVGVVEMGMNAPGEIDTLAAIAEPEVGVVTNAAAAHLEGLGSVEAVAWAKAELWGRLPVSGCAVVPADDPRLSEIAEEVFPARRVRFGKSADCDIRIAHMQPGREGNLEVALARAGADDAGHHLRLGLLGRHQAWNAAAAAAGCVGLGYSLGRTVRAFESVQPLPGRGELRRIGEVSVLDDTYNANPASVIVSARSLVDLPTGAPGVGVRGAVIGDLLELGATAERMHYELGAELAKVGIAVVIGVGPLSAALVAGALENGAREAHHVDGTMEAARLARRIFRVGDRVLVKGSRGMVMERVLREWAAPESTEAAPASEDDA